MGLARSLGLGAEVGGGTAGGEETANHGLEEGVEDNLGTASLGKSHPHDQDELENVVEGEPVSGADSALNDSQESEDNPVREPLGVILGAGGEKCLKGVVTGDEETGKVDEELASNVKEDKEEVDSDKAKDDIDLGDIGLTLKVGEDRVLGELLVKLSNRVLSTLLERGHFCL